jgi:potassium efflux system protein
LRGIPPEVAEHHPDVRGRSSLERPSRRIGEHGLDDEVRCFFVARDATRSGRDTIWLTLFRSAGSKLGGPPAS